MDKGTPQAAGGSLEEQLIPADNPPFQLWKDPKDIPQGLLRESKIISLFKVS